MFILPGTGTVYFSVVVVVVVGMQRNFDISTKSLHKVTASFIYSHVERAKYSVEKNIVAFDA